MNFQAEFRSPTLTYIGREDFNVFETQTNNIRDAFHGMHSSNSYIEDPFISKLANGVSDT